MTTVISSGAASRHYTFGLLATLSAAGIAMLSASAAVAEKIKVAIPQQGLWETMLPQLGEKAGIFKKENIEIEPLFTRGGSETVQAVLAGSVDIAIANGLLGTIGGFAKGAPIRVTGASVTGTPDVFWYVKADSPIKSAKDFAGKKIGFSRPGSSSHLVVLSAFDHFKAKGNAVPCGGLPGCLTQVMSGQIDVAWAAPPFRLDEVRAGTLRVVMRASEVVPLQGVTVRVDVTSAATLAAKRDLLNRFHRALNATLEYAYSNDKALDDYAAEVKVSKEVARETRDVYYPKAAMQKLKVEGLDVALKQALEFKFIEKPMQPADLKGMIEILGK